MPNLAISLHATTEEQRDMLVPINRKYGLKEIARGVPPLPGQASRTDHVRVRDVAGRQRLTRRRTAAGEVTSRNPGEGESAPAQRGAGIPFERPSDERVDRFARILSEHGVTVSVRKSRGRDIRAACGQLITDSTRTPPRAKRLAMLMGT
jgi:23S rRNA (adenine2503-C2)-methyltransferase